MSQLARIGCSSSPTQAAALAPYQPGRRRFLAPPADRPTLGPEASAGVSQ